MINKAIFCSVDTDEYNNRVYMDAATPLRDREVDIINSKTNITDGINELFIYIENDRGWNRPTSRKIITLEDGIFRYRTAAREYYIILESSNAFKILDKFIYNFHHSLMILDHTAGVLRSIKNGEFVIYKSGKVEYINNK